MIEIKIVGRGGQGGKTAAAILAKIAIKEDKYIQSFPEYGAERQGAPVFAYTRISNSPINIHCGVTKPNIVAVLDPTLLSLPITSGVPDDGIIIVNTSKSPKEIKEQLNFNGKLYTVDATKISIKHLGKNIPNTPMLGAINEAAKLFKISHIQEQIKEKFGRKLNKDMLDKNIACIKEAATVVKNGT